MRYRKKPVTIDALKVSDVLRMAREKFFDLPAWLRDAYDKSEIVFGGEEVIIRTREGQMRGDFNDWIIRGVKGELYPCKPDIFAETYELVNGGS